MKVLVTHPGLQHAHHLAEALYEHDALLQFWSGVPLTGPDEKPSFAARLASRIKHTPIPAQLRRHPFAFPLMQRMAGRALPAAQANWVTHRLDQLFDLRASAHLAKHRPDMLICYENAALRSFVAAKKGGALCILDAPSLHYEAQAEALGRRDLDGEWIRSRKRAEIEAADFIITCSAFAAESFAANGVAPSKLLTCPLGTELPRQRPTRRPHASPMRRFIFVGSIRRLKGVDVLLDVFEHLGRERADTRLTLVGSIAESDLAARARRLANVELIPHLSQPHLFDVMAQHDCLLLPSRLDGFGMVVPEAMSAGLPVIVSERVGAKMIIEQYPEAGWVVPLDKEHLRQRILHIANNPGVLVPAARAALQAARAFTWDEYRRRVVALLRDVYAAGRGDIADGPPLQGAA